MATELKKVEPGDLIKSELMNQIIYRIEELTNKVGGLGETGSVTVPSLFGRTLLQAATIIKQPQFSLQFGNVVDAFGTSIDPDLTESRSRVIINQIPAPGARANPGGAIDVLIAASGSTGGGTNQQSNKPIINTTNPFNPVKVPIGQDVTIFGNNFALDRTKNKVTFDGVPSPEDPTPESTKTMLVVKVPAIPNPPPAGGEKQVTVIVETPDGRSAGANLTLLPALSGQDPKIDSITSSGQDFARIDEVITLNGAGFSTSLAENRISFSDVTTSPEPTGNSATVLKVKVPVISGVVRPDDFKDVSVFVTVNGRKSNVKGPFTIGGKV